MVDLGRASLAAASGVFVVGTVGVWSWQASIDDETRVRWLLRDAVDAFNDADAWRAMQPLAAEWVDRTTGADLRKLRAGIARQFRDCRYWLELVLAESSIHYASGEDDEAGTLTFVLELHRGPATPSHWGIARRLGMVWKLRVMARLACRAGSWVIVSTSHETLAGRCPS